MDTMILHGHYRLTAAITSCFIVASTLITVPFVSSLYIPPLSQAVKVTIKRSSLAQHDTKTKHFNNAAPKNMMKLTTSSSSSNSETSSDQTMRREFLVQGGNKIIGGLAAMAFTTTTTPIRPVEAAETVGKDPDCNDGSCLGVWDGLLADCPHDGKMNFGAGDAGCVSSQDDTPGVFAEPWDYSEAPNNTLDWEAQMRLLIPSIELICAKRGDKVTTLQQSGRYLRVLFTDGKTGEESIGEFYFTPEDTTVQFRVGSISKTGLISKSLKNMERCEMIRKELRYLKVPVLRNRKRALFFVESDFDTFGPGSAALGPPAEMTTGELEGRQDVDPKLKIDALQAFPVVK